jgi:hypothetical protein
VHQLIHVRSWARHWYRGVGSSFQRCACGIDWARYLTIPGMWIWARHLVELGMWGLHGKGNSPDWSLARQALSFIQGCMSRDGLG